MRDKRPPLSKDGQSPSSTLLNYCKNEGWDLSRHNLIVEGDSDVEFFDLASRIYENENGRPLLDKKLAVLSFNMFIY